MPKLKESKRRGHLTGISAQGNVTRGVGLASRASEEFELPPKWIIKEVGSSSSSKVRLRYRSPSGQYFNSLAAAQECLASLTRTTSGADTPATSSMEESGSEYYPTPRKGLHMQAILEESVTEGELEQPENCIFFTELRALTQFIDEASALRKCSTDGCLGRLVPVAVNRVGFGGGARVQFTCDGCTSGNLIFNTSTFVQESRRYVASLSVALAFMLTGHMHSGYHNALGRGLGIPVLQRKNFYNILKDAHAYIKKMLDEMCARAKEEMKALPADEQGSWENAVTTADGCWLTRGHFSQNCTFIIKNYLTNTILWYGHACMRGDDDVIEEPLYPGTSKSAEGYLAEKLFQKAKDEGCCISVNWQDSDSSAAKSVKSIFPSIQIMYCAGHVGRAHSNQLNDLKAKKTFTKAYTDKHVRAHPTVATVACCCARGNHRAGCGCITEGFIRNARISHFLVCIQAGNDPNIYAQRMRELGKYHARGIHSWDGGQCSFHPSVVCSCGGCDDGDDLQCVGKPYESKFVLSCELHSLGYEIECERRALNAESVIHTVMGRGHSNLCEAAFNILPRFRAKSLALHRLSYITLTNWGLIMSCVEKSDISPYVSLFSQMGLPVLDGMADIWKADIEETSKALEKKKTDEVKKYRIQMKTARVAEQQERKQWTKRQQILHSYGNQEEELEPTEEADPLDSDASVYALIGGEHSAESDDRGDLLVLGDSLPIASVEQSSTQPSRKEKKRKPCKCGSTSHSRVSFHGCPLNKNLD